MLQIQFVYMRISGPAIEPLLFEDDLQSVNLLPNAVIWIGDADLDKSVSGSLGDAIMHKLNLC